VLADDVALTGLDLQPVAYSLHPVLESLKRKCIVFPSIGTGAARRPIGLHNICWRAGKIGSPKGQYFPEIVMKDENTLRFGALTDTCLHIRVYMQRLFADDTDWHTPWMERVLPNAVRIVEAHSAQTIFTRFIPAQEPGQSRGAWRRYYQKWESMTIGRLGPDMVELVPELARFVPPGRTIDKHVYSPWLERQLDDMLRGTKIDTLVVSGGETDVCVLATVLGAIDRGYRVVVATDALCSSSDETHDAMMTLYHNRYGQQVETVTTETILENWRTPT